MSHKREDWTAWVGGQLNPKGSLAHSHTACKEQVAALYLTLQVRTLKPVMELSSIQPGWPSQVVSQGLAVRGVLAGLMGTDTGGRPCPLLPEQEGYQDSLAQ